MEFAGNEKKIQALFRELKLVDEHVAPGFISVWNRAQATSPKSSRVFEISFAMALALIVIALSSLVLWSRNWQRSQEPVPGVATGPTAAGPITDTTTGSTPAPPPATPGPTQLAAAQPPIRVKSDRKVAARRHAEPNAGNPTIREAVSISSWQSPTATLMQSPADDVLTSLPQLDRSLTELKTFLPNIPQ